jgi:hypothetical protein
MPICARPKSCSGILPITPRPITEGVCQAARQTAERAGRPYLYLRSSQLSKEDFIEQIVRRDRIDQGLIAVLT